jgi:hypothetical protein
MRARAGKAYRGLLWAQVLVLPRGLREMGGTLGGRLGGGVGAAAGWLVGLPLLAFALVAGLLHLAGAACCRLRGPGRPARVADRPGP